MPTTNCCRRQSIKVALLTFHSSLNHGAALQAYASQEAIKNMGVECEIIDYENEYRKFAHSMGSHAIKELREKHLYLASRYCAGSLIMRRRRKRFIDFYDEHLCLTSMRFSSSKEAETLNSEYDKFIVGSDQVWNYENNGNDFAYLLDFVHDDGKKVSYSSSFGLITIPDGLRNKYIDLLVRIKHLSTRESYGVQLIEDLTGRRAELVLDPVFLLNKKQWLSVCGDLQKKEKYVLCYTNRPNQWNDFLNQTRYSIEKLRVYKMTRHLTIKDLVNPSVKVKYSISPMEFISNIACAELVVTASFHCIGLSILLNVPFVAVLTGDQGKDERVLNILRITGLEKRILNSTMTLDDVNEPIDFGQVESRVEYHREKSMDFLRHALFG